VNSMATRHAPDVGVPLAHILTGAAAALAGGLLLVWRGPALLRAPVGELRPLALTHIFTLGWQTMTIVGATYQLVPVVLEVRLRSEGLARAGYAVLLVGIALLVGGFCTGRMGLSIPGALLTAGALLAYSGHLTVTVLGATAHRMHRLFFLGATAYLAVVCALGALMAADLRWNFLRVDVLPVHVIAAVLGWVTLLAMGVACKLTPMFALSHGHGAGAGRVVFGLWFVGTVLLILGVALGRPAPALVALSLPLVAAIALFLRDQHAFFRTWHGPHLDAGLRLVVAACGYLAPTAVAGWLDVAGAIHLRPASLVILAALGWLGCLVAGLTYTIVPFLVWFYRDAGRAGLERVPLLREMYDGRLAEAGMWGTVVAGVLLAAAPWLLCLGGAAWLCGYGVLAYNLAQVLRA